ncbi:hypothetical protein BXZ70DRAFT_907712 [Cristinia sonorae]|uniref:Uncharacterized protein n=1 Tax=Cristinia sonorae TaxID=1940300 RepID=A0A8K0XPJ3_9AGAR|nr:hypothetical protein BXZ70DRAFT_907712 [Cristinia sonorae]
MLPKFSNPHQRLQSLHVVSRHDLRASGDEDAEEHLDDSSTLDTLETLVKRSLGEFQLEHGPDDDSDATKRRKRRKVETPAEEKGSEEEAIPFRLISKSRTPFLLSLKPKPAPVFKVVEPEYEDTADAATIRAERAVAVAVDAAWILRESQQSYQSLSRRNNKLTVVKADDVFDAPPMFVLETLKPSSSRSAMPKRPKLPEQEKPSPHNVVPDKLKYPIVDDATRTEGKKRKPRRRGKTEPRERPPPAFWRPMMEWRGKSAGYAYGFTSSRPIWTAETRWRPYRRDNMRKATLVI